MNEFQVSPSTACLAGYVQGKNDGFREGVILTLAAVWFWKMYKRGRGDYGTFVRVDKKSK